MLYYEERIHYLDKLLEYFSSDETVKFNILSGIHYPIFFITYIIFVFTRNLKIFITLTILFLLQVIFNIIDDGCFLMKLERKYIGKDWYGGYHILEHILPVNINVDIVKSVYRSLMVGIGIIFIWRIHKWNFK
jgi:hypothetical protein